MSPMEMEAIVTMVATNPTLGDLLVGSGGYRIVTYFGGQDRPVHLLAALSKGDAGNFSDAEVAAMATAVRTLFK